MDLILRTGGIKIHWRVSHPVFRAQTPIGAIALIAPEWGFSHTLRVSNLVSACDKSPFSSPVSASEIPVPGEVETGSMAGWWLPSLSPAEARGQVRVALFSLPIQ
jgi:hypothetical protein